MDNIAMRPPIEVLREVFEEWLCIRGIQDYRFYAPEEWSMANRSWAHSNAELILTFDEDLSFLLNFGDCNILDELVVLAEGCGYLCELGDSWNLGFYGLELSGATAPFSEEVKEKLWQRKRLTILKRGDNRCEECATTGQVEVHHCYNRSGRHPWQYPDAAVLALCKQCHTQRIRAETNFLLFQQSLRTEELTATQAMLAHCKYWYDGREFVALLRSLVDKPDLALLEAEPCAGQPTAARRREMEIAVMHQEISRCLLEMLKTYGNPFDRGESSTRGRPELLGRSSIRP
jgi:hypothetical protein